MIIIDKVSSEGRTPTCKKAWKPKIENLNMQIIKKDIFVYLNKYYSLYSNNDIRKLENAVVRNIKLKYKRFDSIHDKIPIDLYNRIFNRKRIVVEEDRKIRVNLI